MIELLDHVDRALSRGRRVAIARVVRVEGSSPRDPGAALVVDDHGEVFGSVSGGCVEGAVVAACTEVLEGAPARVCRYGIADDLAATVGLTCGGTVHVLVEPLDWGPVYVALRGALRADAPVALVTVVEGPALGTRMLVAPGRPAVGSLGDARLDVALARDAAGWPGTAGTETRRYGAHGEPGAVDVFVESFSPAPRMVVVGAGDFTVALVRVAKLLGYRVTVCDPRSAFATAQRLPEADEIVVAWPDVYLRAHLNAPLSPRDAICVLTHDHKLDVAALVVALETEVGYIGAMGSRRTTAQREERLREAGVDERGLARIRAPLGLDLGARTPAETAISICAEIIGARTGRSGAPLRDIQVPIHSAPGA